MANGRCVDDRVVWSELPPRSSPSTSSSLSISEIKRFQLCGQIRASGLRGIFVVRTDLEAVRFMEKEAWKRQRRAGLQARFPHSQSLGLWLFSKTLARKQRPVKSLGRVLWSEMGQRAGGAERSTLHHRAAMDVLMDRHSKRAPRSLGARDACRRSSARRHRPSDPSDSGGLSGPASAGAPRTAGWGDWAVVSLFTQ